MPNPTAAQDPHSISQGNIQNVSDLVFGTPVGDAVTITSVGTNIPVMVDKEFFEIRNHPTANNNGLYQVDDAAPAAGTVDVRKVSGSDPSVDGTGRDCDILCSLDTAHSNLVWANSSAASTEITDAILTLPTMQVGERFEIRNANTVGNDGVYQVTGTVTDGYAVDKITGSNPVNDTANTGNVITEQKSVFWDTAGLGIYLLEQPGVTVDTVTDAVWGTPTGALVTVTSAGNNLPVVRIGQKVLVSAHSTAQNNGYYVVRGITTVSGSWDLEMVSDGKNPASAASESVDFATDPWFDDTGVFGQPLYTRGMIDWLDDNFLFDNAGFPMFNIDSDAGKYLVGQNAAGTNTGWDFVDNTEFGVRSRKLVRNMGWQSIDTAGAVKQEYAAIRSNATVEDNDRDLGYYQFGTDTTTDDTVDFEFAGPVDEAILVFDATVTRAQPTATEGYDFNDTGDTIDRNDPGGSFITDGYKVGGRVIVANATTSADDGTYLITAVAATALTVTTLTGGAVTFSDTLDDNTATLTLDNRFAFSLKLRPRDDDALGKTFAQQGLADALASQLSNRAFIFGLGCVEDANITNTDATVSAYGVTITFHASGQSRGGATLVGGAQNFGIIIEGNNRSATEIYEAIQYSLRQLTDIDADGDTAIGRTIDGLVRFNGTTLEFGSVDGGLSFPTNPDGGGSGVYCDNVAAADANNVKFWDNTGVLRSNKETIAVTLDANQILIDDTLAEMDLYFDRTVRTNVTDLVITAAIAATETLTLTANAANNDTVVIDGKTYTFQTSLTDADGNVLIGATASDSIDNLIAAINLDAGEGTLYAESTVLHPSVSAAAGAGDTMDVTALTPGAAANSIATTETSANMSWGNATLTGGTDATITSAGANLPVLDVGTGAYIRLGDGGLVYQVEDETSQSSWDVVRYDGQLVVAAGSAATDVDEHPFDTPDSLIVDTVNLLTDTTISFTNPDTIGDTNSGLGVFSVGDRLRIAGAGAGTNAGKVVTVATAAAGTITIEQNQFEPVLDTQAAGGSVTLTQIAAIEADADFAFNFGFDDNVQGGRTISTTTFVKGKAIGRQTAQYAESAVLQIATGTPLTVPLQAQQERNVTL